MIQKGGEKPEMYENVFSLRIYDIDELKEMLSASGFELLSVCGLDGSDFSQYTTQNMLVTARKI